MRASVIKIAFRSVKSFFGRYLALLLIVAISVGFFAGLRITQGAMIETGHRFLKEQNFVQIRLE